MATRTCPRSQCQRLGHLLISLTACLVSGCGWADFHTAFPAEVRRECKTDGHLIRAVHFTFAPNGNANTGKRGDTGQVTITFGDATGSFDVPASFVITDVRNSTHPTGTITITFVPDETALRQYRDLAGRVRGLERPGQEGSIPDELPKSVQFAATTSHQRSLTLVSEPFGKGDF